VLTRASEGRWLLPAAFILLGLIWGSSFAWIKVAVAELPPATLVAERMTLAALAMLIFLVFTRPPRPTRGQVGHLAVMGAVNAGLPIFLISWGEQYIDSGTAAVLNSLVPIFSLLVAGLVLRTETWSLLRVIGILTGFAGAAVLASREFAFHPGAAAIGGAVAVAAASLSYAIGASYGKHRIQSTDRYVVAAGTLGRIVLAQAQWAFGVRGRDGSPPRTPLTQWWDTPELIGGASTMMGTGVHSVDLLRFVLGAEVDEITAVTDGQTVARPLEQLACLTLRFGNGTLGQVVASRLLPDSRNDFRVYGITGLIAGHHSMWEARTGRFEITSDTVNETADYPEGLLPNYVAEIEDFQRAVATGGQPAATGLDGLRVVEVTLAMIESARTRRSVKIERVEP